MKKVSILGVIEGFYGRPWTPAQRGHLFGCMAAWGLDTYLYAPKDDRWHRQLWRDVYPAQQERALRALTAEAHRHGIRLVYALSPGLDLDWDSEKDRRALADKFASVQALGVQHFALLFDDISYAPDRAAQAREQVAAAHHVLDTLWPDGQAGLLLFCPTEYCGERAEPSVAASPYLRVLGETLRPGVDILWTGPQVVSSEISVQSVLEVNGVVRRPVLIWDNLHANDFTLHRANLGPYAGRPLELREQVAGILSNPNNQPELNPPGLFSLADYAGAAPDWTPEASLDRALEVWLPEFNASPAQPITLEAVRLLEAARQWVAPETSADERAALLSELRAARHQIMTVLHALEAGPDRELLFSLHPYLVDVTEELQRLIAGNGQSGNTLEVFKYRGSLADRLMELGWPEDMASH